MPSVLFLVFLFISGCSAQWQGSQNASVPGGTPTPGIPPTYLVRNLVDSGNARSGFVTGTSTGSPTVGCQFDGGAVVMATGSETWRCRYPLGWKPGTAHTVKTGMWNGSTLTDSILFHITKQENRDLNGDGIADAAVGDQYGPTGQRGAAYVFSGTPTGLGTTPSTILNAVQVAANHFGSSLRIADVNGDGFADLLVAAPDYDFGSGHAGAVHVYFGSTNGVSTTPDITLLNPGTEGYARFLAVGDVNGDGFADLVVATSSSSAMVGQYLYLGSASGYPATPSLTLNSAFAQYNGVYAMAIGDLNGDGYDDVAIGIIHLSTGFGGDVYVYYGASGNSMSGTAGTTFSHAGQCFGESLAIGDVDGDGVGDLAVGQTCAYQTGAAYVYPGSGAGVATSPSVTMAGHTGDETFGTSIAVADFNGDGIGDVLVGAPYYSNTTGALYVYNGSGTGPPTAFSYARYGVAAYEYFAFVLQPTDLNNDGVPDLLIGSYGGANGFAQVYTSDATGLSATPALELVGPNAGGYFGYSVASHPARYLESRWAGPVFSVWQWIERWFPPPRIKRVPPHLPPQVKS